MHNILFVIAFLMMSSVHADAGGEAAIQFATSSCQEMERRIKNKQNPFAGWRFAAKFNDWNIQQEIEDDILQAQDNVESNNGDNGLPWLGGIDAGGRDQQPIRLTSDIVRAGYNATLNRLVTESSAATADPDLTPLVRHWPEPNEAAKWAVRVLGDVAVKTEDGAVPETTPGFGLMPVIETARNDTRTALSNLVNGSQIPTREQLAEISVSGVLITVDVINTLRSLTPNDRQMMIGKLADEAAMANVLEKAMTLRQLLLTGRREPNVAATEAGQHIADSINTLDQEIENILFEKRVRKEMLASTGSALIELSERKALGAATLEPPGESSAFPRGGALESGN